MGILNAAAAGQIVVVGGDTSQVRGPLIGYFKGKDAVDDESLAKREYIIPEHRWRHLGIPRDLDSVISDLRDVGAIVEPGPLTRHAKRGLYEGTPGEGKKVPSVHIKGAWVHA